MTTPLERQKAGFICLFYLLHLHSSYNMSSVLDEDLLLIDEDSEQEDSVTCSSTHSAAGRAPAAAVGASPRRGGNAVVMATQRGGGTSSPITARLHIIANVGDASDAESIVDNNHPTKELNTDNMNLIPDMDDKNIDIMNLIPDMDEIYLNNLDKGNTKLTEVNKYLIPDMPDLFEHHKPTLNLNDVRSTCREPLPFSSIPPPPRTRSDSVSSLTSDASLPAGESRRGSYDPSVGGQTRRRSSKRPRPTRKPRLKSRFGDATLQYIRDRLQGVLYYFEVLWRKRQVLLLPNTAFVTHNS